MTAPIVQRLRATAAALRGERVSIQALAQAHGPAAHGTLLLLMAVLCLVPGVGTVLGLGLAALATAMWRGHPSASLPRRVVELELSRHSAQVCWALWHLPIQWRDASLRPGWAILHLRTGSHGLQPRLG